MVPALTLNQKTRECEIENADAIYDTGPILFYFFFFKKKYLTFMGLLAWAPLPLSATAGWSLSTSLTSLMNRVIKPQHRPR